MAKIKVNFVVAIRAADACLVMHGIHMIPVSDSREVLDTYIVLETVSVSSIFVQGKFHHALSRKMADEEYLRRKTAASRVKYRIL